MKVLWKYRTYMNVNATTPYNDIDKADKIKLGCFFKDEIKGAFSQLLQKVHSRFSPPSSIQHHSVMVLPPSCVASFAFVSFVVNVLCCIYVYRKFDISKALYFLLLCDSAQTCLGCSAAIALPLVQGNEVFCSIMTWGFAVVPINFHFINLMTSYIRYLTIYTSSTVRPKF